MIRVRISDLHEITRIMIHQRNGILFKTVYFTASVSLTSSFEKESE